MPGKASFAERVDAFHADAPARHARRANRTSRQKVTDAVVGYGGLLLIVLALLAVAAVVVYAAIAIGSAWGWIIAAGIGVFVLAVLAASEA